MNNHKILLTKEGLEELKSEYDILVKVKRPEGVKRMADAREQGDLSENSEYSAAREDLALIDGRIIELEEIIRNAELVQSTHFKGSVDIGCKVTVRINGRKDVYMIVGEWEADPKEKKISHSSPLGKALMGKRVGEKIEVVAPVGKIQYTVLHIE